jgi:hypothetical protein
VSPPAFNRLYLTDWNGLLTLAVFSNPGMSLNGEFEAGSADGSFSG